MINSISPVLKVTPLYPITPVKDEPTQVRGLEDDPFLRIKDQVVIDKEYDSFVKDGDAVIKSEEDFVSPSEKKEERMTIYSKNALEKINETAFDATSTEVQGAGMEDATVTSKMQNASSENTFSILQTEDKKFYVRTTNTETGEVIYYPDPKPREYYDKNLPYGQSATSSIEIDEQV